MTMLIASALVIVAVPGSSQPVPGSMDVHWNEGSADCKANPQPPLQVHRYEPRTFILRQSPCANFEANFLYLLVGSEKALLIDTGAVSDPVQMPLAKTVVQLLPRKDGTSLPLLVVHSHGHRDHRAADAQFESLPSVEIVPADLDDVRAYFGFDRWPSGVAHLDLGSRTVAVLPAPGHESAHLVFYDDRTALLFAGDFLMPGRLLIDDLAEYRDSAARVTAFIANRPVSHVLGGHIELDAAGAAYATGSEHHPNEHALELARSDLPALQAALANFNGFYARHARFILSNPVHNLVAALTFAVSLLLLMVLWVRRAWRRRRAVRMQRRVSRGSQSF